MALESSVARRYARALVELATEANAVDAVTQDLQKVWGILIADEHRLLTVMANPGFTVTERRDVLASVLPVSLGLHPLVRNLLFILLEKHRFGLLADLIVAFQEASDRHAGRLRATVTGAFTTPPVVCDQVSAALSEATGQPVILSERIDPNLIAGLVLQVGDTVYDASLKTRLECLKALLLDPSSAPHSESPAAE